ncbi:MAG: hypothetical protein KDI79_05740 [Anaerolineae bacterium]|nr:hypothetical protein [Anaerolineae bacterium]
MPEPDVMLATWNTNLTLTLCEACDSHYLLPPALFPFKCPTCFQATLIEIEAERQPTDLLPYYAPELLIPFTVSHPELVAGIQQFAGRIWFAPGDLKPEKLISRLQRLYLPMWLVDSDVEALWQAEVGFNYEVVSHRDEFDQNDGGWHSQQVTEQRIRWEPRLGRLKRTYHNLPAPALEQHTQMMQRLGEYNLAEAVPFQAQALEQAVIHLPDRPPTDAWPDTIPAFQAAAAEECRQASRADHLRGYRWSSDYRDQHWTLLLLPVCATYYVDDEGRPQPIMIHGRTGRLSGPTRASMKRARTTALIIVAVAAALFILSLILGGISLMAPRMLILAGISLLGALIIGMLAITPIIVVWQYNRNQSNREREEQ